ncbi:hypothetical protein [Streptomyces sp. t39]|uniref:hypothetical protein n=1 Tax=Streptomyces sp. t39 TaxID=1828156 RepID=UPI0011CEAB81|nr:hypothetical protein [Streptomyces sp. t39]TXS54174.1 hypothetical protein EAO77_18345 [Streptomyces sp. t39]
MDQDEDRILAAELAALGAVSGGSGRLTGLVAKVLRTNAHEVDLVIALPFDACVRHVATVLERAGRPVASPPVEPGGGTASVRVVAGGGAGGLNPVVVTAWVARGPQDTCTVRLRGAAKEGLIKQRAGEKTATRLAALLSA